MSNYGCLIHSQKCFLIREHGEAKTNLETLVVDL